MPSFGAESERQLATCHPDLQRVLREAIKHVDFAVICGHRGQAEQDKAFAEGKSQVKWPNGQHNALPSRAVDIAPYPINWQDNLAFVWLNGFVCGIAAQMGVRVRSGVDWDADGNVKEHTLIDAPHIELR